MPKPYVAINEVEMLNNDTTMQMFQQVGPKVCQVTARHPGFVGFQNHAQFGIIPMGTRWGGGSMDMTKMDTMNVYQYTMWKSIKDHEDMHRENFSSIFRLCSSCLSQVVYGPWEPLYEIVDANMPLNTEMADFTVMFGKKFAAGDPSGVPPISMPYGQRTIALSEHTVKKGSEKEFESTIVEVMKDFENAPGFLGYMILKEVGVSAVGSFQLKSKGIHEILESGGEPPTQQEGSFKVEEARPTPPEYRVHMEWASPNDAMFGIGRVLFAHPAREIHDKVLDTLIRGPYIRLLNPMMEGTTWREYLNSP